MIVITVSDTGIGIEEQYIQQIFDPFYTTKDIEKGTGLGLAVVYGIIKKHKGAIAARNNEGKGTIFTITLPHAYSSGKSQRTSMIRLIKEKVPLFPVSFHFVVA